MSSLAITRRNEKIKGYHEPIHDFFDSFSLPTAQNYLLSACKAAESHHIWNKKTPLDLLFFFESLDRLLSAVFAIVKSSVKSPKARVRKLNCAPNLNQRELYCAINDGLSSWDCFPRSLSVQAYYNPYSVLQKFTTRASKKEWKRILRDILNYALGSSSLSASGVNLKLVRVSELLQKLLDACHLIDVRVNIQKNISETEN